MFNKKKKNDDTQALTESTDKVQSEKSGENEVQFEKNIKTLWIYTTLFCIFVLALIVVSSIIQSKINSKAEYYQDQYESAQTSSQSTIKNIQDENAALKKDLETYKAMAEQLEIRSETDAELINDAAELIENAEYLLSAQQYLTNGNREAAREQFIKVNSDKLTGAMLDVYETLQKRLD